MPADVQPHPCCDVRGLFPERNHYFTGKYMTARDFRDEQRYFLTQHRWHQWTLHGWGVVWGLEVHIRTNEGGGQCITICPGTAIDCHGRELVLPYPVRFSIEDVTASNDEVGQLANNHDPFLIGLEFAVHHRELVPLLVDECEPGAELPRHECQHGKHNRVREFAAIRARKTCKHCWPAPQGCFPGPLPKWESERDHYSYQEHMDPDGCHCPPANLVMHPPCACEPSGFVPLALLEWQRPENELGEPSADAPEAWSASDRGRRYVRGPFYGEALTHIVDINWKHGGDTPLSDLRQAFEPPDANADKAYQKYVDDCSGEVGRIKLSFDRRLAIPNGLGAGDMEAISTYYSQLFALDYLIDFDHNDPPGEPLAPRFVLLSRCRRKLYCDFPVRRISRQKPVLIRLSVRCDLIVDERGRAVDGDHICGGLALSGPPDDNGRRPDPCRPNQCLDHGRTGDGIEGGTFFSWTKLT